MLPDCALCVAHEQGFWVLVASILVPLAAAVFGLLVLTGVVVLMRDRADMTLQSGINLYFIKIKELKLSQVKLNPLIGLLIIGATWHFSGQWYSVLLDNTRHIAFDISSAPVSLARVKEKQQSEGRTLLDISDAPKDLMIKGDFGGRCLAVVALNICQKYSSDLVCDWNYTSPRVTIRARD
ncbi:MULTISPECIES: hypothetical protein [Kordiimonas]|jgi:hypothetical protein|uniref:hypothetical protein n=1 Tax=Kordiimonas TaxID=288021 RepID=UPI00257E3D1E|nr:hypothetical protein [Kordiimonas sp. UBA4487]